MQPGCLMKILEAERWLKGTNFREVAFLQRRQGGRTAGAPHPGLGRWKDAMHEGSAKTWLPFKGVTHLLKATLPTCVLSRRGLSLLQHAPRFSPYDAGAGSHASCKLAQGRKKLNRRARCAQLPSGYEHSSTSAQASGRKGGPPCRRHATAPRGRTLSTSTHPAWRPRPTRHVTGAPESAFIPFVSFGDLDNNTFKGLTSLLSVEQEIQYDKHT
jgi:hypothetical protein